MISTELKNGAILGCSAAIAMLLVAGAFQLTKDTIEATAQLELQSKLAELLTPGSYDNQPSQDVIQLSNPALGTEDAMLIYRARSGNKPTGAVITALAPDGYNGAIDLLIGVSYDGEIVGVRVSNHAETPGLGDDIETQRSDWIYGFNQQTISEMSERDWQVKKDGGQFDQFTGATITPRAIVHAVYRVAQWYESARQYIFSQPTIGTTAKLNTIVTPTNTEQ